MKYYLNLLFFAFFFSMEAKNKVLIFGGKTGWIGSKIALLFKSRGFIVIYGKSRLENREALDKEIEVEKPDYIINAASITGRPNSDWCEKHKDLTIRSNVIGALNLVDIAFLKNIHITNIGTACLYTYDDQHMKWSGVGFTEVDEPNIRSTIYFTTKIAAQRLMKEYPNLLDLRLSFPLASDFSERNMLLKLTQYSKVINEPNSWAVLDELLPIALDMILKKKTGPYNFSNPGVVTHNELLDLYKEYIDPSFSYFNFTVEEQSMILKGNRPMFELDVSKLIQEYPQILPIKESLKQFFINWREQLKGIF